MNVLWTAVVWLAVLSTASQAGPDPTALVQEADRLAWLRAWSSAEPLYVDAKTIFAARGNERDALYAEVGALRGRLPRMSVPAASAQLASYLEIPIVKAHDRLRLRVLTVKGDTDVDLDPALAGESWREALAIAERLGDGPWANRAKGELGLIAFLEGDVGASVVKLGQALKVAQTNGDVSSVVRWLTLFGHGYVQLGRPQEALDFYDRALKAAAPVPELQFPVMTYVGKSNALIRLGRLVEADAILDQAAVVADKASARGYQAQLLMQRGMIADQQNQVDRALALMSQATELAKAAGGNRVVAEIAIEAARIQRRRGQLPAAERSLNGGIAASRAMEERLLLPKLLGELADLRSTQRRFDDAAALLDEAADMLEGLFTTASSPWVQSRLVSGMDDVFVARIHLEGARRRGAAAMYSAIEQARGRSLLQLLANRPLSGLAQPKELQEGQRRIAELQRQLLRTSARGERRRLLERIFAAEEQLAPVSTEFFDRARRATRLEPPTLLELQAALKPDELFLEFALTVPRAYVLVATQTGSRVQTLTDAAAISSHVAGLRAAVADGKAAETDAQHALGVALLGDIPELRAKPRLLVSPDGPLHQVPFELLAPGPGGLLLDSHIVSYVPSGAVLTRLRRQRLGPSARMLALAVSASPEGQADARTPAVSVPRGIYDLDASKLKPLPAAADEARAVATILGAGNTKVLIGPAATEGELKQLHLRDYRVLHFAVHGIPSSKFPARAALLLNPGESEDGVFQAREILTIRLDADLVTLSACETGAGSVHGQDGPASLVRPFIAAGARTVVANLWAADDTFSLALIREFYRQLASGADVADALRKAKQHMLKSFGSNATPRLWSGMLAYGDGRGVPTRPAVVSQAKGQ